MSIRPADELDPIELQLIKIISERLLEPQPGFNTTSNLYDAGLDSMALMQLLILVEEEYGVSIPEGDITKQNFSTAQHLARLIRERRST